MEVDQEMNSKKIMTFLLTFVLCIIVEVSSMEMNSSVSMVAEKGKESETENVTFKQISCMSNSSSVKCPPRYFRELLLGKSWDLKASECKTTGSKLPVVSQYNLTIITGFTIYLSAHGFINRIYFCDKGHPVVLTKMKFQSSYCHRNGRLPFVSIQRYWSLQERKDWFLHQASNTVFKGRLQFLFQSISALNFKLQFQNEVCTILIQITICQKHTCIQDSTSKTVLQVMDLGHKAYKQKLKKQSIIKMCLSLVTKKLNIETCDIYKQPVLSVNKTIMCHIYTSRVLYFAQRDSLVLVHYIFMCVSCIYLKSKSKYEVLPSIYESEGSKLVTLTTNFICIKLPFICIFHVLENISINFIWKLNASKLVTSCSTVPFITLQSNESIHMILSGIFCSSKKSIGLLALFSSFHCNKLLTERKRKNNLVLLYVTEINIFGITNSPNLLSHKQNIAQISFAEDNKKCLNIIQNSFIILLNIILLLALTFYSTDLGGLFGFKNLSYFKILLIFGLVLTCEASSAHSHINTSYLFAHQPVLPKSTSLENVVYSSMQQDDTFSKSPLYISSASATFNITSDNSPKSYNMKINEVLRHSGTLTADKWKNTVLISNSNMVSTIIVTNYGTAYTDVQTNIDTVKISSIVSINALTSSDIEPTETIKNSITVSNNALQNSTIEPWDTMTGSSTVSINALTNSGIELLAYNMQTLSSMSSIELQIYSSMVSINSLTSYSMASTVMLTRYGRASTALLTSSSNLLKSSSMASSDLLTISSMRQADLLTSSSMTSTDLLTSSSVTSTDLLASFSMISTDLLTSSSMTQTDLRTSSRMTTTDPLTSSSMTSTDLLTSSSMTSAYLLTSSSMTSTDMLTSSSMTLTDMLTNSSMTSTDLLISSSMTSTDLLISSSMTSTDLLTNSRMISTDLLTNSRMISTDLLTNSRMISTDLLTNSSMTSTDLLTNSRMISTDLLTSSSMTQTDLQTSSRMTTTDPLTISSMTSTDLLTSSSMTSSYLLTSYSMTSTDLLTSSSMTSTDLLTSSSMTSSYLLTSYSMTSTDLLTSSSMTSTDLLTNSRMISTDLLTSSSMTQTDLQTSSRMTTTDPLTISSMTSTDLLTSSSMTSSYLLTSYSMTSTDLLISSSMTSTDLLTSSSMTSTDLLTSSSMTSTDLLISSSMTSTDLLTSSSMTSTDLLTSSSMTQTDLRTSSRMTTTDPLTSSSMTSTDLLTSSSMTSTYLLISSSMTSTDLLISSSMTSTDLLTSSSMTSTDLLTSSSMALTGSSIAASNLVTSSSITSTVLLTSHGMASTDLHTDYIMVHPDLSVIFTKITGKQYADLYSSSIKLSWDILKGSITEFTDQLTMSTIVSTDWLMSSDMLSPDLLTKSGKVSTYLMEKPNTVSRTQKTNFNTVFTKQQISSSSLIYDPVILFRKVSIDKITQSSTILINKLTRSKELSTYLVTHATTELTDQITSSRMVFGDPLTSSFKIPITILKTSDRIYSDHLIRFGLISINLVTGLNAVFNKLLSISTETYSEPITSSSKVFTDNIKSFYTASSDNLLRSEIGSTEILLSYSILSADIMSSSFIIPNDPLCKSHTAYIDPSTWYDVTSEIFETGFSVVFTDSLTNSKISPDFLTSSTLPSKLVTSTYVESNELQTSSTTSTDLGINPGLMSTNLRTNSRLILMNRLVGSSRAYPSLMTSFSKIFTDVFIRFSSISTDQLTSYRMTGELLRNSSAVFTDNLTNSIMLFSDIETRPSIASTDQWKNSNEIFIYSQTTSSILSNDQLTWEISSTLSTDQISREISSTLSNNQITREISSTLSNDQLTRVISSTLSNDQIMREVSSTLSNDQLIREISSTLSDDHLMREISSTLSDDQLMRVISSTLSHDQLTWEISSTLSNDQLTRVISSTLSNDQLTKEISSTLSNDQLTKVISSTVSDDQLTREISSTLSNDQLMREISSTLSDDQLTWEISSTISNNQSTRETSSTLSNNQLTWEISSTLSNDQLMREISIYSQTISNTLSSDELRKEISIYSQITSSTLSDDQLAREISSTLSNDQLTREISSTLSNDQLTGEISSTLSNDQLTRVISSTPSITSHVYQLKNSNAVSMNFLTNFGTVYTDVIIKSIGISTDLLNSAHILSSVIHTSPSMLLTDKLTRTIFSTDLLTGPITITTDSVTSSGITSVTSVVGVAIAPTKQWTNLSMESSDLKSSDIVSTDLITYSILSNDLVSSTNISTDNLKNLPDVSVKPRKNYFVEFTDHPTSSSVQFTYSLTSSGMVHLSSDLQASFSVASIDLQTMISTDLLTRYNMVYSDLLSTNDTISINSLSKDLTVSSTVVTELLTRSITIPSNIFTSSNSVTINLTRSNIRSTDSLVMSNSDFLMSSKSISIDMLKHSSTVSFGILTRSSAIATDFPRSTGTASIDLLTSFSRIMIDIQMTSSTLFSDQLTSYNTLSTDIQAFHRIVTTGTSLYPVKASTKTLKTYNMYPHEVFKDTKGSAMINANPNFTLSTFHTINTSDSEITATTTSESANASVSEVTEIKSFQVSNKSNSNITAALVSNVTDAISLKANISVNTAISSTKITVTSSSEIIVTPSISGTAAKTSKIESLTNSQITLISNLEIVVFSSLTATVSHEVSHLPNINISHTVLHRHDTKSEQSLEITALSNTINRHLSNSEVILTSGHEKTYRPSTEIRATPFFRQSPEITATPTLYRPHTEITATPTFYRKSTEVSATPALYRPSADVLATPTFYRPSTEITATPTFYRPSTEITATPTFYRPSTEITATSTFYRKSTEVSATPALYGPSADVLATPTFYRPSTEITATPTLYFTGLSKSEFLIFSVSELFGKQNVENNDLLSAEINVKSSFSNDELPNLLFTPLSNSRLTVTPSSDNRSMTSSNVMSLETTEITSYKISVTQNFEYSDTHSSTSKILQYSDIIFIVATSFETVSKISDPAPDLSFETIKSPNSTFVDMQSNIITLTSNETNADATSSKIYFQLNSDIADVLDSSSTAMQTLNTFVVSNYSMNVTPISEISVASDSENNLTSEISVTPTSVKRIKPSSEISVTPSSVKRIKPSSEISVTPSSVKRIKPSSEISVTPSSVKRIKPSSEVSVTQRPEIVTSSLQIIDMQSSMITMSTVCETTAIPNSDIFYPKTVWITDALDSEMSIATNVKTDVASCSGLSGKLHSEIFVIKSSEFISESSWIKFNSSFTNYVIPISTMDLHASEIILASTEAIENVKNEIKTNSPVTSITKTMFEISSTLRMAESNLQTKTSKCEITPSGYVITPLQHNGMTNSKSQMASSTDTEITLFNFMVTSVSPEMTYYSQVIPTHNKKLFFPEITATRTETSLNSKAISSSAIKLIISELTSTHPRITATSKTKAKPGIKSMSPNFEKSLIFNVKQSSHLLLNSDISSLHSDISSRSPVHLSLNSDISSRSPVSLSLNSDISSRSPVSLSLNSDISSRSPVSLSLNSDISSTSPVSLSLNSDISSTSPVSLSLNSDISSTSPVSLSLNSDISSTSPVSLSLNSDISSTSPVILSLNSDISSTSPVSLLLNSDIPSRSPNRTLRSEVISSAEIKSLAEIGILQPLTKTSWFSDTLSSEIMSSTSIMVSTYGTTSIIKISPLLSRKSSSNHNHISSFKMTSNSEMISFIPNLISSPTSTSQILFQTKVTSSLSPEMTLFIPEMTSSSKMILSSSDSAFMSIQSSLSEITLYSQIKSTSLITSFNSKVTLSSSEITSSSDVMPRIYETTTLSHDKTSTSSLITSSSEIKASFDSTLIIPEIFTFDEKTLNSEIMTSYEVTSLVSKIRSSSLELISSSKIQTSSEIKSVPLGITPSSSDTTLLSFAVTPKSEINASVTSKSEDMTSSSGLLSKFNNLSISETTYPFKISTSDATSHSKMNSIIYETNTMNPGPILNSDIQSRFHITSAIFEMITSSSLNAISKNSEKPLSGMTRSRVNTLPSISEIMPSDSWVTSRVDIGPLGSWVTSRVDIRSSSYWIKSRMGILSSSSEIKSTDSRIITVVDILPSNSDIIIGFGVTSGVEVLQSNFGITSRFEVLSSSPGMMLSTSFSIMQSVSTSVTIPMTTAQEKVTDILLLKVKVKNDVDIFGDKFNMDTVRGLMECFKEGRAQSPHNRKQRGITMWERKNVHQLREMLPGNIEVKITDVSRDKKALETVLAQFYIKENGAVVPVKEAAAVYGQLTIQEISALLTYPVLQPIMPAAAMLNIAPNNEEFFTPVTITLICIFAGVLVLATIVLLLIFCRTRWKQKESSAKYWRKYSSIVKRKPTLTDYDLMVDMEMGEVINASHSPGRFSFKNLHNWKKETYNESTIVKQVPELDVKQLFELSKFPSAMLQQALSTKSQAYSDSELLWKQLVWKLSMEENNKVMTFSEPKSKDAQTSGKHLVDEMIQTDFDNSEKNRKVQNNTLVNKTAETVTNVLPRHMAHTILNTSPVSKHRKSQFKNKTTPIKYGILSLPNRVDLISKSGEEFSNKMFTEPGEFEISLTSAKDYKQKQLKNENANSLVSDSGRVVHHSIFTSSIGGLPMDKVPIMKNSVKDEKMSTTTCIPTIFHGGKMSLFSDISSLDDTSATQDKQMFLFRQREPHAVAQQETMFLKDLKQLGKEKPYKSGKQTESDILFTTMTKRNTKKNLKYPKKYPNIPVEGYCNRILEKPFYTKLTLSSVKQKFKAENHDQSGDNGDTSKNMFCTPKSELTPLQQNSEMDSDFAHCLIDDGHLMLTDDYDSDHEFYPIDQNINHDDDSDQETYPMYENVSPIFLEYFGGFYDVPQSTLHFGNFRSEEFDDGSEFAGYEFEALNFGLRSNYPYQNPVNQSYNTIMEPNAAIFEHVTKMGRIGIPKAHQSEPVYRQPSYHFDDLTDTPLSTARSNRDEFKHVDMKLGRNMRARPRQTSDKDLIETLNRQKQTRRQLEVEKEHYQAKAGTKRWKTEDSLHRINSPSDQKEQTSAKVPPLDTESQSGLTKSNNVEYIHDRGVRTEKDNDEDEKNDSSKEVSDINDF